MRAIFAIASLVFSIALFMFFGAFCAFLYMASLQLPLHEPSSSNQSLYNFLNSDTQKTASFSTDEFAEGVLYIVELTCAEKHGNASVYPYSPAFYIENSALRSAIPMNASIFGDVRQIWVSVQVFNKGALSIGNVRVGRALLPREFSALFFGNILIGYQNFYATIFEKAKNIDAHVQNGIIELQKK